MQLGDGMADNLHYINASDTTFDNAALILGAMGSKTIGIGIIASAHSSTSGYVKFANGLLIQWGRETFTSVRTKIITKTILSYTSTSTYNVFVCSESASSNINSSGNGVYKNSASNISMIIYGVASSDRFTGLSWLTIGY